MDGVAGWPGEVAEYLYRTYGAPVAVERLGGMSAARIERVRFAGTSVVVKGSLSAKETRFYERVAPRLRVGGIPIPRLEWSAHLAEGHWLILEDVAEPLPRPFHLDWRPDPRTVAVLARLHALAPAVPPHLGELFEIEDRRWTDAVTDAALDFFAPAVARALEPPLRSLQAEGQHVTAAWCWISGDPNITNWGVRDDGSVVLYDWELFRRGTPAVDLAILVMGNGDMAKYRELAACYLDAWRTITDAPPWAEATLARDIALAKAWNVTWFLSRIVTRAGEGRVPQRLKEQIAEYVPPWVQSLARRSGDG